MESITNLPVSRSRGGTHRTVVGSNRIIPKAAEGGRLMRCGNYRTRSIFLSIPMSYSAWTLRLTRLEGAPSMWLIHTHMVVPFDEWIGNNRMRAMAVCETCETAVPVRLRSDGTITSIAGHRNCEEPDFRVLDNKSVFDTEIEWRSLYDIISIYDILYWNQSSENLSYTRGFILYLHNCVYLILY